MISISETLILRLFLRTFHNLLTHLAIGQPCELRPSFPVYTTTSMRTALPFSPYLEAKKCGFRDQEGIYYTLHLNASQT